MSGKKQAKDTALPKGSTEPEQQMSQQPSAEKTRAPDDSDYERDLSDQCHSRHSNSPDDRGGPFAPPK